MFLGCLTENILDAEKYNFYEVIPNSDGTTRLEGPLTDIYFVVPKNATELNRGYICCQRINDKIVAAFKADEIVIELKKEG